MTNSVMNTAWKNYGSRRRGAPCPRVRSSSSSTSPPLGCRSPRRARRRSRTTRRSSRRSSSPCRECGRRLARFIRRGAKAREEAKKRSYIEQYIPHVGVALKEILSLSDKEEERVVDSLRDTLEKSRTF